MKKGLDAFNLLSPVSDPCANKIRECHMSEEKLKEYMRLEEIYR